MQKYRKKITEYVADCCKMSYTIDVDLYTEVYLEGWYTIC